MRRVTDAFAVLIAVAGFAISYTTQALLASSHGFPGWEAWLWPGIADAAALAMMLRLHFGQVRPGWYTVEAWLVFAVASGIMVGANGIADRADPLGGLMHAAVPIVGMLVWHVVIHGAPRAEPEQVPQPVCETKPARARRRPRPTRLTVVSQPVDRVAQVRALLERGEELTSGKVASLLGVSRATGGRLLARAQESAG